MFPGARLGEKGLAGVGDGEQDGDEQEKR